VLDPSRLGKDLLVFLLVDGDDLTTVVEDHEPGAGRALIQGTHVLRHAHIPIAVRRGLLVIRWDP